MAKRTYIVVVESSAIIRRGVVSLLEDIDSLSVDIVEDGDVSSLSSIVFKHTPDILIVNPSHLGLFSPAALRGELGVETLKVVALQSAFADHSSLANYDGVISINDSVETISQRIESIAGEGSKVEEKRELSVREREIIVCVVKGMTNKQIADTLYLSTHTVIAHRRNIANKLQIHSPSGLTIYAIVNKLVDLTDIKDSISRSREVE